MWRGLYIAASGMITETKHTDMIANNLANAATTGFKRDDMAIREFKPMLLRRINDHSADTDVTSFKGFRIRSGAPIVGTLGLG
ncbi:MAG: flagellar basal-body rod protein FlgG, partial [Selenomonas sp.]|nr:flagellar basal-body rod protein FlgG [Selenomonas sp.]